MNDISFYGNYSRSFKDKKFAEKMITTGPTLPNTMIQIIQVISRIGNRSLQNQRT